MKKDVMQKAALAATAVAALAILNQRWNRRFTQVKIEPVEIVGDDGRTVSGRRLRVQSLLAAPVNEVWARVLTPALLAHVARPLLAFEPNDGDRLPTVWQEGETAGLSLRGFGFLPLGRHDIHVRHIDHDAYHIETAESGQLASIWNHTIQLDPVGPHHTRYTDQIDIHAGLLTPFITTFAWVFYRHRQTRWQKLVSKMDD